MKFIRREIIAYLICGGLNTLLGYCVYAAMLWVLPYAFAYSVSYILGVFSAYYLNAKFVFRRPLSRRAALGYPGVYIGQYGCGVLLLVVFVEKLRISKWAAPFLIVCLTVPLSFILSRMIIVRPAPATDKDAG